MGPSRANGSSSAKGFFSDYFGLSVPAYPDGTLFTVTAQILVDGLTFGTTTPSWNGQWPGGEASYSTFWQSWVRVIQEGGGATLVNLRDREDCAGFITLGSPPYCTSEGGGGTHTFSFQIPNNGWRAQLDMRGWASAGASVFLEYPSQSGVFEADGVADLGNTIAWGGITELRDANGQLITDFSAISATSGFDYRNAYVSAVPIPAAVWLFGSGLLGLIGVARRKKLKQA